MTTDHPDPSAPVFVQDGAPDWLLTAEAHQREVNRRHDAGKMLPDESGRIADAQAEVDAADEATRAAWEAFTATKPNQAAFERMTQTAMEAAQARDAKAQEAFDAVSKAAQEIRHKLTRARNEVNLARQYRRVNAARKSAKSA